MNKGYLKKLLKDMKQVYHITDAIKHLKDRRISPEYSAAENDSLCAIFCKKYSEECYNKHK